MKACISCNQEFEKSQFYSHPQMTDGTVNVCKTCTKERVRKRYYNKIQDPEFVNSERLRGRKKYRKYQYKPNPEIKKKCMSGYHERYPEKRLAAIASNHLPSISGDWHHWSYNEQHFKDCIPITKELHQKVHRYMVYDRKSKMYKTLEGTLLDTRDKHEAFIELIMQIP